MSLSTLYTRFGIFAGRLRAIGAIPLQPVFYAQTVRRASTMNRPP
jgi:hypothetical protein